jgi:hypothetical protein
MLTKRFSDRASVQLLSSWLQLPRSTFYYKAHPGQRGMRPSTHTLYKGSLIANEEVVGKIKELISGPVVLFVIDHGCVQQKNTALDFSEERP